jgi:enoyl-[acyl-carrier protein] reductase II
MGFVAHERLASAVANAGGLGMLGASPDPPESLRVMVDRLRALTSGPFGVDLICADLPQGPASTHAHIETCVELGVKLVAFHHDLPPRRWVEQLHASGARVWKQVSSAAMARAAIDLGIDGLVAQGIEAGGHCESDVPMLELVGRLRREHPEVLVLAAGGIVRGEHVAAALRAGADGVWVGTRLIASDEAHAHAEYKRRLVDAQGETLVTTAYGPEWPDRRYRVLPTRTVREWTGREQHIRDARPGPAVIGTTRLFPHSANLEYQMPKFSAVVPTPATSGEWEEMAFPAGAGVGAIVCVKPAGVIVQEMMAEAVAGVP